MKENAEAEAKNFSFLSFYSLLLSFSFSLSLSPSLFPVFFIILESSSFHCLIHFEWGISYFYSSLSEEEKKKNFHPSIPSSLFQFEFVERGRREKRTKRFEWKDLEGREWKTIRQRKKKKSNKVTILEKLSNEKWKKEEKKLREKKKREREKMMRMDELEWLPYPLYWSNSNT